MIKKGKMEYGISFFQLTPINNLVHLKSNFSKQFVLIPSQNIGMNQMQILDKSLT